MRPCAEPTSYRPTWESGPTRSSSMGTLAIEKRHTGWHFISQRKVPPNFSIRLGEHRRFRNVLIVNGPQYKFNTVRVQPEDGDTCGLYCVHFVKYRYGNSTLEGIVNEFSARDPKTIEAELKDIYELILCTTTIYIVNKKN